MKNLLNLTPQQERRRLSIAARMRRCLRELSALASQAGCREQDQYMYYECEGQLCVFDTTLGDPGEGSSRQDNVVIVVELCGQGTPGLDCGAW